MKTTLLVVGAVTPVAIAAQQYGTTQIKLYQNNDGVGSAGLILMAPTTADAHTTRNPGAILEFYLDFPHQQFEKGVTRGFILSAAGSINVAQEEFP